LRNERARLPGTTGEPGRLRKKGDMTDSTYQGWSNYETWLVSLWLDNDQGSYDYWRDRAASFRRGAPTSRNVLEGIWTATEAARFGLADALKEAIVEDSPLEDASVYSDLLNAALYEVNWDEIAGDLLYEEAARGQESDSEAPSSDKE